MTPGLLSAENLVYGKWVFSQVLPGDQKPTKQVRLDGTLYISPKEAKWDFASFALDDGENQFPKPRLLLTQQFAADIQVDQYNSKSGRISVVYRENRGSATLSYSLQADGNILVITIVDNGQVVSYVRG